MNPLKKISCAAFAFAASCLSSPANIVLNGSFEENDGDLSHWTYINLDGSALYVAPSGFAGYTAEDGNRFAGYSAQPRGGYVTLTQDLATGPGTYEFEFWLNTANAADASFLNVNWGGLQVLQLTPGDGTFGWTHYDYLVTAAGGTTAISFSGLNSQAYFALDNVSVTQVPDAGVGLITLGVTLCGLSAWSQRSRLRALPRR